MGFETRQHESEMWECLRNRSVPLKFAYAGDSAKTHDRLAHRSTYKEVVRSAELETSILQKYNRVKRIPTAICEVGPGNGMHSLILFRQLKRYGIVSVSYLLLDFSRVLLQIARKNLRVVTSGTRVHEATWDFESRPSQAIRNWRKGHNALLILLLGQTLGNINSPITALKNLARSANVGDLLLIGVTLAGSKSQSTELDAYRNITFTRAATQPLVSAGISAKTGEFQLRYESSPKAVVGEFVFRIPVVLRRGRRILRFAKGERIRCFVSRRFLVPEVIKILHSTKWNPIEYATDMSRSHLVVLSEKR